MSITTILLFIAILLVLVTVHEFGHFIVAKLVGMRVDEFAFGFPPRIFAKKVGETVYAVNALPIGGYVSIWGENGSEDDKKADGAKHHPRAFGNRPWWAKLLVLVAGVAMNMVLALVIFIGISYGDVRISTDDDVYGSRVKNAEMVVVNASPESPAYKAGIVPGVVITKVVADGISAQLISTSSLINFIATHNNSTFAITFKKATGEVVTTSIAPVFGIVEGRKAIGVSVDTIGTVHMSLLEAFPLGVERTYQMTLMTIDGIAMVFTSVGKGENVLESLSGPIGIAKIVGETSEYGIASVLSLVAVLSINLAVFNMLPLPALDGGRFVIVVIETVVRRKIPFTYFSWMNVVGFGLLLLLLIVVSVNDVMR